MRSAERRNGSYRPMSFTKRLDSSDSNFWQQLQERLAFEESGQTDVHSTVAGIIGNIRVNGDRALLELTEKFDQLSLPDAGALRVSAEKIEVSAAAIQASQLQALQNAAQRIRAYAEKQKLESWQYTEADGTVLGQQITPLDSVGLYVPGGKAAYPSSVLMNSIPAKVAGVKKLVMVVPTPNGELNNMVLAAAAVAGVDEIYTIGGAQAIAALAYGTETIPSVDKIVGPGNIFVTTAKRLVFGKVGIDSIAGPSEILIYADATSNPDWIAMDLFSQAEHDELAQAILVSTDDAFIDAVGSSMQTLAPTLPRENIIRTSMQDRGMLIKAQDQAEAIEIINYVAPEHLELAVETPEDIVGEIRHAGAIFMGSYSSEALGDYCAGPNHVLPTSRSARFSSPLGVYDFQKRSSIINCSQEGASTLGKIAAELAYGEGLQAHARSAEFRIKSTDS